MWVVYDIYNTSHIFSKVSKNLFGLRTTPLDLVVSNRRGRSLCNALSVTGTFEFYKIWSIASGRMSLCIKICINSSVLEWRKGIELILDFSKSMRLWQTIFSLLFCTSYIFLCSETMFSDSHFSWGLSQYRIYGPNNAWFF